MAVTPLLNWDKKKKLWYGMHQGVRLKIAPKTLGRPRTFDESVEAANEWCRKRMAEIDGARTPAQINTDNVRTVLGQLGPDGVLRLVNQGQAANEIIKIVTAAGNDVPFVQAAQEMLNDDSATIPSPVIKLPYPLFSDGTPGKMEKLRDEHTMKHVRSLKTTILPEPSPDELTIGKQFSAWSKLQLAGKKSAARKKMNIHMLTFFRDFMGENTSLTAINEDRWEGYWHHLAKLTYDDGKIEYDDGYKGRVGEFRSFIKWLGNKRLVILPMNLEDPNLKFEEGLKAIKEIDLEDVRTFYAGATGQTRLHIHLMLNCAFLGKDIAELAQSEIDWKRGTITRRRSKTRKLKKEKAKKVPVVTYKLWARTLELLKEYDSGKTPVLLTVRGLPWINNEIDEETGDDYSNSNSIASNFKWLTKKTGVKMGTKDLRTAAATTLGKHEIYKFYGEYFIGDAPSSVTSKHYQPEDDAEFFRALAWLEKQIALPK